MKEIKIFINGMLENKIHRLGVNALTIEVDGEIVFDELEDTSSTKNEVNNLPAKAEPTREDFSDKGDIHSQIKKEIDKEWEDNEVKDYARYLKEEKRRR